MIDLNSPHYSTEESVPAPPPPPPTLEEAKEGLRQSIIYEASRRQQVLLKDYSEAEQATWDKKEKEAQTYVDSRGLSKAPYLRIEAIAKTKATSETEINAATMDVAKRVLSKADSLLASSAKIAGNRANLLPLVDSLKTIEQVKAFDYSQGWD